MPVIRRLAPDVASKIAAGEVIERPASVLKELIENSVDAGASRVDVEILEAGRKLLRVSDDGSGMDPEDCRAAFERHATSKIAALSDIDSLGTFGFRGEALFSIAAVSRVSLTSSLKGTRKGWRVEAEGGEVKYQREAPPAAGTTIEVRDLFYNTPARAKFLKSEASEKGHLLRVVEEAALANPSVTFTCKSEGRSALSYAGGKEPERIREILGGELAGGLLRAESGRGGLSLRAWVSPVESLNAGRSFQFCLINRRPVASRQVQQAVYRAYEPFRPKNRHPVFVLYLDISPDQVDVNVHPTKREVRFRSEREVFEAVASAVSRCLLQSKGIPTLTSARAPFPRTPSAETAPALLVAEPAARYAPVSQPLPMKAPPRPWFDDAVRYVGQIERSYLVFDASGGLLVIDQHAAQERVLFERYLKEIESGKPAVQKLMLPVPVELPASSIQKVLAREGRIARAGFELKPFSKTVLHVTGVPQVFKKTGDVKELVHRLLEGLLSPGAASADVKYDAAATVACKAAVKAHDPLGEREALRLVADLRACEDGTCCPHGRPTMLSLTRDELARRFKRPGAPPL